MVFVGGLETSGKLKAAERSLSLLYMKILNATRANSTIPSTATFDVVER
jgi:hypothetical protein